ncbi:hypothetical protein SAMN05421743_12124 [Thalassobacillus cyri]|uniref:Uncharacterized protein n=1 Tax=Thalassobacillus cyri TaxID=571932 RepID=A0A1H4H3D2_9BACI|nr:hypothetical protein SAMN05421743_12124 [Thalassobacillus cyri]
MEQPRDHLHYKLVGTSENKGEITCYVLNKEKDFDLIHIKYKPGFKHISTLDLRSYLCALEQDILSKVFDDHKKTLLYTKTQKALQLF